jgi:hypothetical protein
MDTQVTDALKETQELVKTLTDKVEKLEETVESGLNMQTVEETKTDEKV